MAIPNGGYGRIGVGDKGRMKNYFLPSGFGGEGVMGFESLGKLLLSLGGLLIGTGLLFLFGRLGLGRLPGI